MIQKKLSMKNRRGVSNIIGSLIVLAIVASVGSVILFQGLNQISAFNYDLRTFDEQHSAELREDILFEHVRFEPTGNEVILYLANIGSIDATVATVTIVKIDTQELILREEFLTGNTILLEDHIELTVPNADLSDFTGTDPFWNDPYYDNKNYKISITTSKGKFFDTIAQPPNT